MSLGLDMNIITDRKIAFNITKKKTADSNESAVYVSHYILKFCTIPFKLSAQS